MSAATRARATQESVEKRTAARAQSSAGALLASLTIPRSALLSALERAALVSPRSQKLPILSGAYITAARDGLTLTTTDIDRWLTTTLPLESAGLIALQTPFVLPIARLTSIVQQLMPAPVTLELFGSDAAITRVRVIAGRSKFEVFTLAADEFPTNPPRVTDAAIITIPAGPLLGALGRTVKFTSHEQSRPEMNGVNLRATDGELVIVATDGYHLLRERIENTSNLSGSWIVPREAVDVMTTLLSDAETFELSADDRSVRVRGGEAEFLTRLIAGPFPGIERALQFTPTATATLDRVQLTAAVKRALAIGSVENVRRVSLDFAPGELRVSASAESTGTAEDFVACDYRAEDKPSLGIDFNSRFLLDALGAFDGNEVTLQMVAHNRQITLIDPAAPSARVAMIAPLNRLGE